MLLLSPCMAYSGKSNAFAMLSILASSKIACSYRLPSLFCRPWAIFLQWSVRDVHRSNRTVWRSSERLDWDLWDCCRHWGNSRYVHFLLSGRRLRVFNSSRIFPFTSGGGLFGLLCKNSRFRRTSVVFLGMVVHFVAFYLIFLNIPDDAPVVFETTTLKTPYLTPR